MNQHSNRKHQSEGGLTHQEESFVNVSEGAKIDQSLQESLLEGSVHDVIEFEFLNRLCSFEFLTILHIYYHDLLLIEC